MKVLEPGPDIIWLGHDSFKLVGEKTVFIDPYQLTQTDAADIILVTHNHGDHCDPASIAKIYTPNTVIVAPSECKAKLAGRTVQVIAPDQKITVLGVAIEAVAAYNTNKFRSPGQPFHPKADGKVGFIVTLNGRRIYHAGDTDYIPEMSSITCDIALLPVSGTYTMTAEEAVQAAKTIKPKLAIPMHYGVVAGSAADAETFKRLAPVPVTILTKGV